MRGISKATSDGFGFVCMEKIWERSHDKRCKRLDVPQ